MKYSLDILVAGRSRLAIEGIERSLQQHGVDLTVEILTNGQYDPLHHAQKHHDILIYVIGENWKEGLASLSNRPPTQRPHTLVVGPDGDVAQYRAAMRAGARDYLTEPVDENELANALKQITQELQAQRSRKTGDLVVVMNTKGGSGASVIATNLAYIDNAELDKRVLLVDLDLQFGALPSYLDLASNNGLMKALRDVDALDAVAVDGIVLKHANGLRVLAASQDEPILNEEIPHTSVAALFRLLGHTYDEIVVDMPRQIDAMTSLVLNHADKILLVMEASLAHARDAKRLLNILEQFMGLPRDRIKIVVNRYDKNGNVRLADIRQALVFDDIVALPSDFKRVNDSINIGAPLLESAHSAPVTRGLIDLAQSFRADEDKAASSKRGSKLFEWARPLRFR